MFHTHREQEELEIFMCSKAVVIVIEIHSYPCVDRKLLFRRCCMTVFIFIVLTFNVEHSHLMSGETPYMAASIIIMQGHKAKKFYVLFKCLNVYGDNIDQKEITARLAMVIATEEFL
jgi:hypothetical protein